MYINLLHMLSSEKTPDITSILLHPDTTCFEERKVKPLPKTKMFSIESVFL